MIGHERECEATSTFLFQVNDADPFCPQYRQNFGRGRYIPVYNNKVKVHISVERRIEDMKNTRDAYTPQAYNWDALQEMHKVQYVV